MVLAQEVCFFTQISSILYCRCLGEIVDNYEKSKLLLAERDFIGTSRIFSISYPLDDWCCKSPKNYQIWFHRRWLVETIRKVSIVSDSDLLSFELDALEDLIELEPKHYNAWSHRLFVSNLFNSFSTSSELDFTQKLIDKDVYNNSAWSYRRHALKDGFDVSTELLFTMDRIRIAFSNESPWVYATSLPGWLENETFVSFCHQSYSNNRDSVPLANTMVDIYVAHSQIQDAIDTLKRLSNIDPVREYMYSARICQLDQ